MSVFYVLWENTTANVVGDFDTEEEAYSFLRQGVAEVGRDAMSTLLLVRARNDDDSDVTREEVVAEGVELLNLAHRDNARLDPQQPRNAKRSA